jgi:hypothetical protein
MTTPINHHLTIVNRNGILIRGEVVFVYANLDASSEVHIVTRDEPDSYQYAAVYCTPMRSVTGTYIMPTRVNENGQWLCKGRFTTALDDSAHAP